MLHKATQLPYKYEIQMQQRNKPTENSKTGKNPGCSQNNEI